MLTNNSITNATAKDERQLDLRVGISYNADIKKAKSMIEKLLSEDASILKEEQMNVFVMILQTVQSCSVSVPG